MKAAKRPSRQAAKPPSRRATSRELDERSGVQNLERSRDVTMTHRQRNWAPEGGDRPHHDSKVWRLGKRLAVALYDITSDFPDHERFGLIAQIRRAGVSVPSNIAEGQARDSDRELLRFLYLARSSLEEIDTQMEIADELGYLDDTESDHVQRVFGDLSRALGGFIRKVKTDISD